MAESAVAESVRVAQTAEALPLPLYEHDGASASSSVRSACSMRQHSPPDERTVTMPWIKTIDPEGATSAQGFVAIPA